MLWLPTGMLVGGALGNLIDRIANGVVTDFIKLPHWPAFNVADMSITFGVLVLLWVLEGPRAKQ
jgi:signal peptidase II